MMSESRIEADVVYNHNQLGEVLVTGIAKMYEEWDVTGPQEDIESGEVLVFYHTQFDGFGGQQPVPFTENVNEFSKKVERERVFRYIDPSNRVDDDD